MEATESLPMELNKVPVSLNRLERRWRLFRPRTKRHDAVWKQLKHRASGPCFVYARISSRTHRAMDGDKRNPQCSRCGLLRAAGGCCSESRFLHSGTRRVSNVLLLLRTPHQETEGRDSAAVKLVEVNESLIVCNVDLLRFRRRGLAECTPGNFSFVLAGANLAAPEVRLHLACHS